MLEITQFDQVFKFDTHTHLTTKRVKEIGKARGSHQLFLDLLLDQLHLTELQKLYPPHDNRGLRELHEAIVTSNIPLHHKQSLIFYLLCDLQTPEDEADGFAKACYLPKQYVTAMLGFWEMDRGEYRVCEEPVKRPLKLRLCPGCVGAFDAAVIAAHICPGDPPPPASQTFKGPQSAACVLPCCFSAAGSALRSSHRVLQIPHEDECTTSLLRLAGRARCP